MTYLAGVAEVGMDGEVGDGEDFMRGVVAPKPRHLAVIQEQLSGNLVFFRSYHRLSGVDSLLSAFLVVLTVLSLVSALYDLHA